MIVRHIAASALLLGVAGIQQADAGHQNNCQSQFQSGQFQQVYWEQPAQPFPQGQQFYQGQPIDQGRQFDQDQPIQEVRELPPPQEFDQGREFDQSQETRRATFPGDDQQRQGQQQKFQIGIAVSPADPALQSHLNIKHGLIVHAVRPNGPAARAGIQENDILISVGKNDLRDMDGLIQAVQESNGEEMQLKVLRKGKEQTITVTAAELNRDPRSSTTGEFQNQQDDPNRQFRDERNDQNRQFRDQRDNRNPQFSQDQNDRLMELERRIRALEEELNMRDQTRKPEDQNRKDQKRDDLNRKDQKRDDQNRKDQKRDDLNRNQGVLRNQPPKPGQDLENQRRENRKVPAANEELEVIPETPATQPGVIQQNTAPATAPQNNNLGNQNAAPQQRGPIAPREQKQQLPITPSEESAPNLPAQPAAEGLDD